MKWFLPRILTSALVVLFAGSVTSVQAQFSIKENTSEAPKEINAAIAKLLDSKTVQFSDAKGTLLCEVWYRKELPAKATPEQVKNGLTFREMEESTVLGAIRVERAFNDYRKQKLKEGVYTLRLGLQPMDGDHQGTAPNNDFCLLIPAADDKSPAILEAKALHERSTKASGTTHPAVLLLFPPLAKADAAAKLTKGAENHWTVTRPVEVKAGEIKTTIGLILTLAGVSTAA